MHCPVLTWHSPTACVHVQVCVVCVLTMVWKLHAIILMFYLPLLNTRQMVLYCNWRRELLKGKKVMMVMVCLMPFPPTRCRCPIWPHSTHFHSTQKPSCSSGLRDVLFLGCLKTQTAMMSVADVKVLTMYSFQINNLVWVNSWKIKLDSR